MAASRQDSTIEPVCYDSAVMTGFGKCTDEEMCAGEAGRMMQPEKLAQAAFSSRVLYHYYIIKTGHHIISWRPQSVRIVPDDSTPAKTRTSLRNRIFASIWALNRQRL